jgi:hypothetical protein
MREAKQKISEHAVRINDQLVMPEEADTARSWSESPWKVQLGKKRIALVKKKVD